MYVAQKHGPMISEMLGFIEQRKKDAHSAKERQNKREGNIKREKSVGRVNLKREKNNTHN